MGSGIKTLGSEIRDHGIGIISFFRDQGSGCTIFAGSGTKIGHAFGIKDQKFACKNWISIEKHTSLSPWAETTTSDLSQLTTVLQRDLEGKSRLFSQCTPALIPVLWSEINPLFLDMKQNYIA